MAGSAVLATFIALTVIFAGATGYLVAYPAGKTTTTTVPFTTTKLGTTTMTVGGGSAFTVGIAYKQGIGLYLVNGSGYTLYYRATDAPGSGKTTCTTAICEQNWPVFYTSTLTLSPGLNSSSFGTITPYNSTKILTYDGYALFYWIGDNSPGSTTGQGIGNFYVATVPAPMPPAVSTASSTTSSISSTPPTTSPNPYGY